ncbi:MAG: molybdopterin molybdotransferase MoeA [Bacteroidetes bacterium]|nr:molybdopterin molybdotransferase MoeA [Bacteroidota bacterium]
MISVEEARQLVVTNSFQLAQVNKKITEALHCVLAETIISPIAYPPFDQSAMDGFAFRFSDLKKSTPLNIIGESAAGTPFSKEIKEGQAIRILTGAKAPRGADTVVMQEKVTVENEKLIINDKAFERGANIRQAGAHIKQDDIILTKGHVINPASIGLLASLGIETIKIFSSPRVAIIVTGNELVNPGNKLKDGQIFESNSYSIQAALESIHIKSSEILFVNDDEKQTIEKLGTAISKSDMVLTTGGISVGKYDFVGKALEQLGVQTIFYKVSQKPGKPLYFGKLNSCLIFGLSGNPAAALTAFYEYAYPAIKMMQGHQTVFLKNAMLPVINSFSKKEGLALFLKGKLSDGKVSVLQGQDSNNIGSFANADCLIYVPAKKGNVSAGELVKVHLLP